VTGPAPCKPNIAPTSTPRCPRGRPVRPRLREADILSNDNLARFVDRLTIEYVRTFPHPVERVWRAITDPAEFRQWFMPGALDLKLGGAYQFGGPDWTGEVLAIDPPKLIRLSGRNPSGAPFWLQYELSEAAGGTRMRFVTHNEPGYTYTPADDLGGDLPAGTDTPWAPGMVGGWHDLFDQLGDFMNGVPRGSGLPPTEMSAVVRHWADQTDLFEYGLTAKQVARIVQGRA
jgi:uncharacterized protein YndB with AHSA1/START domain